MDPYTHAGSIMLSAAVPCDLINRLLQLLEVLLLISELLLQLHELLFFALLDGIVLVGLLTLLKGITLPSMGWRSSSIAAGHDAGACGECCSGLECETGCWADSFDEGL